MAVYVDNVRLPYGCMVMCHMWADALDELLAMADRIGVGRKWIQGHPTLSFGRHRNASWIHFDVSLGCKHKALALGAILTDKYGPVEYEARRNLLSEDAVRREKASRMLARVAAIRQRSSTSVPDSSERN